MMNKYTEDDAKKKWCPHVQIAVTPSDDVLTNRGSDHNGAQCVASGCMAWRRDKDASVALDVEVGYCGLAGQP